MGFKFAEANTIFPAEVRNKEVCVHITEDTILKFPTTIQEDIPLQRTGFCGKGARFCFRYENRVYVGRDNGTWTAYRDSDLFLVKQGTWTNKKSLIIVGALIEQMTTQNVFAIEGCNNVVIPGADWGFYTSSTPIKFAPGKVGDDVGNPLIKHQLLIYTEGGLHDFFDKMHWTNLPRTPNQLVLG